MLHFTFMLLFSEVLVQELVGNDWEWSGERSDDKKTASTRLKFRNDNMHLILGSFISWAMSWPDYQA